MSSKLTPEQLRQQIQQRILKANTPTSNTTNFTESQSLHNAPNGDQTIQIDSKELKKSEEMVHLEELLRKTENDKELLDRRVKELQEKNELLQLKLKEQREQLEKQNEHSATLQRNYLKLKQESEEKIAMLEQSVEDLQDEAQDQSSQIDQLTSQLQSQKAPKPQDVEILEETIQKRLALVNEEWKAKVEELEGELNLCKIREEQQSEQRKEIEQLLSEMEDAKEKLDRERQVMKQEMEKEMEEKIARRLEGEISSESSLQNQKIVELQEELKEKDIHIANLELTHRDRLKRLKEEHKEVVERAARLWNELQLTNEETKKTEDSLEQLKVELSEKDNCIAQLEDTLLVLQMKNGKMNEEMPSTEERETEDFSNLQVSVVHSSLEEVQTRLNSLITCQEELEEEKIQLQRYRRWMREGISSFKKYFALLRVQLQNANEDIETKDTQIEILEKANEDLLVTLERTKSEFENTRNERTSKEDDEKLENKGSDTRN